MDSSQMDSSHKHPGPLMCHTVLQTECRHHSINSQRVSSLKDSRHKDPQRVSNLKDSRHKSQMQPSEALKASSLRDDIREESSLRDSSREESSLRNNCLACSQKLKSNYRECSQETKRSRLKAGNQKDRSLKKNCLACSQKNHSPSSSLTDNCLACSQKLKCSYQECSLKHKIKHCK